MTVSASPPAAEPRNHWRRVGENALAIAGARVISTLTQLAVIAILVKTVGLETLGWILAVMSPVALAPFADLGVSLALQHAVSEANARNDLTQARCAFDSGRHLLRSIALGWSILALPLGFWVGPILLPAPKGISSPELIWVVASMSACVTLYTNAGARLAAGLQRSWSATFWTSGTNLVVVTLLWILEGLGLASPFALTLVLGCGLFAPGWLTGRAIARALGWAGPTRVTPAERERLWTAGLPLAGSGVVGAAAHAFAPIIVAASGGLLASAAFSILQRFFGPALQGHALLQSPFWPEYTHALASGNKHWLKPAIRASVAVAIATSAAVAGAACMLPWIMPLWLGDRAPAVPLALVAWMAGATIAGIASQPFTYLLLGLNRLQRCSAKIAGAQCATIVLIGLLGWIGGAEGVAAALALGATLGVLPILLIEAQAALGGLSSGDGQKATP